MSTIPEQKKLLRQAMRRCKKEASPSFLFEESQRLICQLEQHPRFIIADKILLFHSLPDEPNTHEIIEHWYTKKKIFLPVICGDTLELKQYKGQQYLNTSGKYGIGEPVDFSSYTNYSDIELAVIPGVAFDRQGHRLGRGKGYYDRLMSHPAWKDVYKIGLCFPFQYVSCVPADGYDISVNEVIK